VAFLWRERGGANMGAVAPRIWAGPHSQVGPHRFRQDG